MRKRGTGQEFSPEEDRIILECKGYGGGISFDRISEKLFMHGYDRSVYAVKHRYDKLKKKARSE